MTNLYIGLISGTSMDGIDAVLAKLDSSIETIASLTYPYPEQIKQQVAQLSQPGFSTEGRVEQLGLLDTQLGEIFAEAVLELCDQAGVSTRQISAIGSHGQTIRHRPSTSQRFTIQLADPNIIAIRTGITTVADFRRADLAAGGQGAPLLPLFHRRLLHSEHTNRVILNLGGIANITWLPKDNSNVVGFDTGPANCFLDMWAQQHLGKPFDHSGNWAATGHVSEELLTVMLNEPYFQLGFPKSTGREHFDRSWLSSKLSVNSNLKAADVQATLAELTAVTVVEAIKALPSRVDEVLVCGGGQHNQYLMSRLAARLPDARLGSTSAYGVDGDFVEACNFAWMAQQRLRQNRLDFRHITGASQPLLYGNVFAV